MSIYCKRCEVITFREYCPRCRPIVDLESDLAAEREKREKVEKELEQAREALFIFSIKGHHDTCSYALSKHHKCDCGYVIALEALKGGEES